MPPRSCSPTALPVSLYRPVTAAYYPGVTLSRSVPGPSTVRDSSPSSAATEERVASDARHAGRWADLRARLAGVDPGLTRLRLASIAVAAMVLAVGAVAAVRGVFAPAEPVTVLLFAGVLAMVSNLAVNEPDL